MSSRLDRVNYSTRAREPPVEPSSDHPPQKKTHKKTAAELLNPAKPGKHGTEQEMSPMLHLCFISICRLKTVLPSTVRKTHYISLRAARIIRGHDSAFVLKSAIFRSLILR